MSEERTQGKWGGVPGPPTDQDEGRCDGSGWEKAPGQDFPDLCQPSDQDRPRPRPYAVMDECDGGTEYAADQDPEGEDWPEQITLAHDMERVRAWHLDRRKVVEAERDSLRAEVERLRERLREAANDLDKAANQFAGLRHERNAARFIEKAARARSLTDSGGTDG